MAVGKEIRTQIKSVQNTQKITSAMEMVAASKMRRTQDRMAESRPYADKVLQVVGHLANANPEHRSVYMQARPVKRVGYIVVSTENASPAREAGRLHRGVHGEGPLRRLERQ